MDKVVEVGGLNVVIDSKAVMLLISMETDYVTDEVDSEFVFNNPNKKSEGACGKSFNI